MSDWIDEIQTRVKVVNNTSEIDNLINTIESDSILSLVLSNTVDDLKNTKIILEKESNSLAFKVAERIGSYQEQFISMNGSILTGQMHDSVMVEDSGDGEALVGNTAQSIEGFPYPLVIEFGRGEVRPQTSKFLRWVKPTGEVVFSKYSGPVSPKPFYKPSIDYVNSDIDDLFDSEVMSKIK